MERQRLSTISHQCVNSMAAPLQISICLLILLVTIVSCSDYDTCGKVNLDPTQFAIDSNGVKLFAPWIVALGVKTDEDKDGFVELKVVCSGSILTQNIIISASHCFDQDEAGYFYNVSDLVVRAGATQIESDRHEEFDIDYFVRHPKHDPPKIYYDIALVKLVQKVTFNQRIQAICLPSSPQTISGGALVTVQGWGKSSDGYEGKLTEINVAARYV